MNGKAIYEYINTVKVDKEELIKKIEKDSKKFSMEYNLSEIVLQKNG